MANKTNKQIERKILDSFKINCNQIINNTKKEVKDYIDSIELKDILEDSASEKLKSLLEAIDKSSKGYNQALDKYKNDVEKVVDKIVLDATNKFDETIEEKVKEAESELYVTISKINNLLKESEDKLDKIKIIHDNYLDYIEKFNQIESKTQIRLKKVERYMEFLKNKSNK